jgi:hypothetical protein
VHYSIILKNKHDEPQWFSDSILPGIIPDSVFDMMECRFVDAELDLCKLCDVQGCRCHVIDEATGRKLCPVFFVDAVKPRWRVDQVV